MSYRRRGRGVDGDREHGGQCRARTRAGSDAARGAVPGVLSPVVTGMATWRRGDATDGNLHVVDRRDVRVGDRRAVPHERSQAVRDEKSREQQGEEQRDTEPRPHHPSGPDHAPIVRASLPTSGAITLRPRPVDP